MKKAIGPNSVAAAPLLQRTYTRPSIVSTPNPANAQGGRKVRLARVGRLAVLQAAGPLLGLQALRSMAVRYNKAVIA
jgi:hypothetical protein